ncbi:toxin C-terminal domain-containing protein, partial [Pasteurella multocida]
EYYRDADTHKVVSAGSKNAEFIAGKKGANFNAGLPMHSEGSEESLTKATLTAGRITLNKDSQPIETTADALGINTDLSQAQREVSKPKDVTQLLAEQKEIAKAVGEIKSAVEIYTSNQQEEAELAVKRAKKALTQAEQTGNQAEIRQKQTALFAAEEAQAKWGDKGEYKRTAERLTTLLTGILAKQAAGGIATQLISPEVNQWIKEATTNDKGETDKIANTLAHAIWGAIEATANRGNPTSGAIAAASAELAAPMLAKVLYNKDKAEHLTAEEKAQITALSSITAAVAGGLTAQGSSQSNTTVSSLTNASIGGEIGKVAVENNYLLPNQVEALRRKLVKTIENGTPLEEVYREFGQLSENQRKELSAGCIDAILCRHTTLDLIDQSNQLARDFTSFIGSFFSQLPDEEQGRFVEFIIDENTKSASLLTEKIGFTEALVAQLVNDYINNIGSLNKKVSPKIRDFAKKTKDRVTSEPVFNTDGDAYKVARELGYTKTNYRTKSGAAVFKKGNSYITRDVDGHNGGAWKEASSPEKLNKKETRNGTFDINLNRIGD